MVCRGPWPQCGRVSPEGRGPGAGPRAREDQDRLSLSLGPRRPALGRGRSACGGLRLRPRARRGAEHPQRILGGFNGILQVDGYETYKTVSKGRGPDAPLRLAHCWAHGRRKLREVFDSDASPITEEGLRRIAELYEIEAEIRGLGADARLTARMARSAPLVANFHVWLDAARARVSAKSRVGEKLGYFVRHWDGLVLFLDDGRIEMDTNPARNAIRTLTRNCKNALFAGHDEGGRAWARIAPLIETATMNGVEPFAWLTATLEAIAAGHPARRINKLLPWNFVPLSS
jgi:transposase